MTDATAQHYAREAQRLLNDEVLAAAFERVRIDAMVALTTVDPDDKTEIMRLQAKANCLQDVRDALTAAILATGESDGGHVPNGRPGA